MNWSRNTLRLKEVLKELGFSEITKAMVLNTMGRMTTIPQGARLKGIPMETVLTAFRNKGFEVEPTRTERLKSYLQRLNDGEESGQREGGLCCALRQRRF